MKNAIPFLVLIFLYQCCFSQPCLNSSTLMFAGKWSGTDNTFENFHSVSSSGTSNTFLIPPSNSLANENSGIEKGAIIGGVAGLLVGSIASAIFNPNEEGSFPIFRAIAGEDVSGEIMEAEVPYIVGGTLLGVAIGAFVSHRINRRAMIDKRFEFDFQPEFAFVPGSESNLALGIRFNLRL